MSSSARSAGRAAREVVDLHGFFDDWFAGRIEDTDQVFARCARALAPEFRLVAQTGQTSEREGLLRELRAAHGVVQKTVTVEQVEERSVADELWLVTYHEWQRGTGEEWQGRASSALLREEPGAPGRFVWVHVHETWLPEDRTFAPGG